MIFAGCCLFLYQLHVSRTPNWVRGQGHTHMPPKWTCNLIGCYLAMDQVIHHCQVMWLGLVHWAYSDSKQIHAYTCTLHSSIQWTTQLCAYCCSKFVRTLPKVQWIPYVHIALCNDNASWFTSKPPGRRTWTSGAVNVGRTDIQIRGDKRLLDAFWYETESCKMCSCCLYHS